MVLPSHQAGETGSSMIWSDTKRDRPAKMQRIRDPVHGLITFDKNDPETARRDMTAWKLLNTPEMQRLRRVRQLGVSEFTFPGATHTRFAHSVGVFHTARQLLAILTGKLDPADRKTDRADTAIFAALLHDIGHGPFSHAFEKVQESREAEKNHEAWSADIILREGGSVRRILEEHRRGMTQEVADLLRAEVPEDAYHAIVSSSFDADRLDYLQRDRLMTGSGAGAIDFDWLIENLQVADVPLGADDDETGVTQKTFCLDHKALQAAESFLLARFHLFQQVYLHKTTRGFENLVGAFLKAVADNAAKGTEGSIGLDERDALVRFFRVDGETIENYLDLDDTAVWVAATLSAAGPDTPSREFAQRLLRREPLFALDISTALPREAEEPLEKAQMRWEVEEARLDALFADELDKTVFKDVASTSIYSETGANQSKAHKRLAILNGGKPIEITRISDVVRALQPKLKQVRYYFMNEKDRKAGLEGRK
jgi:uncharacterized protein